MAYIGRLDTKNILNENTTKEVVKLEQNYLVLNDGEIGQGVDEDQAGLLIERGQLPDATIRFNEDIDSWEYGVEGDIKLLGKKAVKLNSSTVSKPSFIYLVDTTAAELSILLPQTPKTGDEVEFIDLKGTFDINNVIVLGNGSRIAGTTENAYLDVKFTNIKFIYIDFDIGWTLAPSNPITLSSNDITNELSVEQINNITQVVNQKIDETGPTIINYLLENPTNFIDENYLNTSNNKITLNNQSAISPGTYNNITVNEKGLVTSASNTQVLSPTGVTPGTYNSLTVNDKGLVTSASNTQVLQPTGVTPGTYNHITVNDKGLVTSANNVTYDTDKSVDVEIRGSNFTAQSNYYYLLDTTSNSITVTLPSTPSEGDWITVIDVKQQFGTNGCVISYDGTNTIHDNAGDLELDLNGTNIKLIYSSNNWYVINYTDTVGETVAPSDPTDLTGYLTAAQASSLYVTLDSKGSINGIAPLNSSGKIDTSYLPPEALLANDSIDLGNFGVASFNSRTGSITLTIDDLLAHTGLGSNKISRGDHNHDTQYVSIYSKGMANGVPELDSSTKIPVIQLPTDVSDGIPQLNSNGKIKTTQLDIDSYFNSLSASSVSYDADETVDSITYTSGNKQVLIKDTNSNVTQVKYYDTNGTSLLATQNFVYNTNGLVISSNWS
jgi:hypothetical protein